MIIICNTIMRKGFFIKLSIWSATTSTLTKFCGHLVLRGLQLMACHKIPTRFFVLFYTTLQTTRVLGYKVWKHQMARKVREMIIWSRLFFVTQLLFLSHKFPYIAHFLFVRKSKTSLTTITHSTLATLFARHRFLSHSFSLNQFSSLLTLCFTNSISHQVSKTIVFTLHYIFPLLYPSSSP